MLIQAMLIQAACTIAVIVYNNNRLMQVTLPHIHFSQDEIEAVQDMDTMREALAMKESHEACFEVGHCLVVLQGFLLLVCSHP